MINLLFDGTLTLASLQTSVGTTENMEFVKLVHMERRPAGKKNLGTFAEVDPTEDAPPDLELVAAQDVAGQVATKLSEGKHLIFNEVLYVEGNEVGVLGFR